MAAVWACRACGALTGDPAAHCAVSGHCGFDRRADRRPGQLAGVAAALTPMFSAAAKEREHERKARTMADRPQSSNGQGTLARAEAAQATGASGRTVQRFLKVQDAAPELAANVMAGVTLPTVALERKVRPPQQKRPGGALTPRARTRR